MQSSKVLSSLLLPKLYIMKASTACHTAAIIFGWFLIAASIPHTLLGLSELFDGIEAKEISEKFSRNIVTMWIFAGVAMFLIGMWVLFNAKEVKALQKRAWVECYVTSSAMLLFGTAFFLKDPGFPESLHMFGFMAVGLIMWLPLMIYRKEFE